jgi:uncharacterized membrane protein
MRNVVRLDRNDKLAIGVFSVALLLTALVYSRLPARMPIHFDIHGTPDGFADRWLGAWLLLPFAGASWVLSRFVAFLMPAHRRKSLDGAPVSAFAFVMVVFLSGLHVLILYVSLRPEGHIDRAVSILLGVFFLAMAQMMPRIRRNPVFGVRTAWTLTSDENWLRTHRVAAYTMAAGGVIAVIAGVAMRENSMWVSIPAVLLTSFVPIVYSFVLARRLPPEH